MCCRLIDNTYPRIRVLFWAVAPRLREALAGAISTAQIGESSPITRIGPVGVCCVYCTRSNTARMLRRCWWCVARKRLANAADDGGMCEGLSGRFSVQYSARGV